MFFCAGCWNCKLPRPQLLQVKTVVLLNASSPLQLFLGCNGRTWKLEVDHEDTALPDLTRMIFPLAAASSKQPSLARIFSWVMARVAWHHGFLVGWSSLNIPQPFKKWSFAVKTTETLVWGYCSDACLLIKWFPQTYLQDPSVVAESVVQKYGDETAPGLAEELGLISNTGTGEWCWSSNSFWMWLIMQ